MPGNDSRNLRLSFERREGRDYAVTAALGDGAPVVSSFSVPLSDEQLEQVLNTLGETRSLTDAVSVEAPTPGDPTAVTRAAKVVPQRKATAEEFGTKLADALFAGEVGALFDGARAEGDVQLRLVLTEDQTELLRIPWEFLCRRGIFIAAQPQTPVLRELWTGEVQRFEREVPDRIRILAVSASPSGHDVLDTDREQARIRAVVADHADVVELDWIEDCTFDKLHAALDTNPHVLHFVGHSFCDDNGDAGLILTRDDGNAHQVSALAFANLIGRAESLQLVVLNSCEGFRAVDGQPYASLAAKLVRVGRSAVIAMQFKITDGAAIRFSEELYKRIVVDRFGIDRAVSEARIAVMGVNEMEFATPVLYLRDGNAELFGPAERQSDSPVVARAVQMSSPPRQVARLGDRLLQLKSPPLIGDDVAELQELLHSIGIDCGPVDGLFGERTHGALEAFQARAGLAVDGICGPATIVALGGEVAPALPDLRLPDLPAPPPPAEPTITRPVSATMPTDPAPAPPPPPPTPVTPARRGGGAGRGVLIGIGVTIVVVIGIIFALGDDEETSATASTTIPTTVPTVETAATAVTDATTAPRSASPEPSDPTTTVLTDEDLFGIVTYLPMMNGPSYVVDGDTVTEVCPDPTVQTAVLVSDADGRSDLSIALQARAVLESSKIAVALVGVSIEVVEWQPPAQGTLVSCPGLPLTDAPPPILVNAVLPAAPTGRTRLEFATYDEASGGAVSVPTPSFPRQMLGPRETIFFDVAVDSSACDCEWVVVLDMLIDGEPTEIELSNDDGTPFRTSGSGNATPSASTS